MVCSSQHSQVDEAVLGSPVCVPWNTQKKKDRLRLTGSCCLQQHGKKSQLSAGPSGRMHGTWWGRRRWGCSRHQAHRTRSPSTTGGRVCQTGSCRTSSSPTGQLSLDSLQLQICGQRKLAWQSAVVIQKERTLEWVPIFSHDTLSLAMGWSWGHELVCPLGKGDLEGHLCDRLSLRVSLRFR